MYDRENLCAANVHFAKKKRTVFTSLLRKIAVLQFEFHAFSDVPAAWFAIRAAMALASSGINVDIGIVISNLMHSLFGRESSFAMRLSAVSLVARILDRRQVM